VQGPLVLYVTLPPKSHPSQVVEDASSALDYALQEKDFIYANHVNMCRFSGFDDDGYEKVTAALSHCLSDESRMSQQSE
jgi:hypothetical protein